MKVYELISLLVDIPSGKEVFVTAYPGGTLNELVVVRREEDSVYLYGDGHFTDDLDSARDGIE